MVSGACEALTKFVTKAFLGTMGWKQNFFELFLLKAFQNFSLYCCFLLYHFSFSSKVAIVTFLSFLQFIFVLLNPYCFPTNFYLLIYLFFYMLKSQYIFLILFKTSWHSLFAFLLFYSGTTFILLFFFYLLIQET